MKLKDLIKEQSEPLDYQYFIDQVEGLMSASEDFHKELSTALEAKSEETGNSTFKQMQNQVARYLQGAEKQIEGVYKLLNKIQARTTQQGGGDANQFNI